MISLCRRQISCIVEEAFGVSGEGQAPPSAAMHSSHYHQVIRDAAWTGFIFKWAAKSFSLSSHQGFLNLCGHCNLVSPLFFIHLTEIQTGLTRRTIGCEVKKEMHSPF